MNGKVSEKNLFIDGVSHKRNIQCGFEFRTLFTKRVSMSILLKYDQCTDIKFILNTFQSRCDGCSVVCDENISSSRESSVRKGQPVYISISAHFLCNSYTLASAWEEVFMLLVVAA